MSRNDPVMAILTPAWQLERRKSLYLPEGKRIMVLMSHLMKTSRRRRRLKKNVIVV